MELNQEDVDYLKKIINVSEPKIKDTQLFISLLSGGYRTNPVPLLQLALAIMHDKPIAIIAIDDEKIPESLRKIAFSIQRVTDPSQMDRAIKKLNAELDEIEARRGEH